MRGALSDAFDELIDDFAFLEDWEDRYRYVIELGKDLEPLTEAEHAPEHKVQGCVSQVWLIAEPDAEKGVLRFRGDSDAMIVKGLIAVLMKLYSGRPPAEILEQDARERLGALGLNEHLSPQRSNGLYSMVNRIRADAERQLTGAAT